MTDEQYKQYARMTITNRSYYILVLTRNREHYITKHRAWLMIMGLPETWYINR